MRFFKRKSDASAILELGWLPSEKTESFSRELHTMLEDIDPRKLDFHMSFIPQLVTLRVGVALQPIHVGFRRYRLVMIRNRHVSSSKGKSQLIESALRRRDRGESSSIEIVYKDGKARPIQPRRWAHGKLRADTASGIRDFGPAHIRSVKASPFPSINREQLLVSWHRGKLTVVRQAAGEEL